MTASSVAGTYQLPEKLTTCLHLNFVVPNLARLQRCAQHCGQGKIGSSTPLFFPMRGNFQIRVDNERFSVMVSVLF